MLKRGPTYARGKRRGKYLQIYATALRSTRRPGRGAATLSFPDFQGSLECRRGLRGPRTEDSSRYRCGLKRARIPRNQPKRGPAFRTDQQKPLYLGFVGCYGYYICAASVLRETRRILPSYTSIPLPDMYAVSCNARNRNQEQKK